MERLWRRLEHLQQCSQQCPYRSLVLVVLIWSALWPGPSTKVPMLNFSL